MKRSEDLVFPENLAAILDRDGIWSSDLFAPIKVVVLEGEEDNEGVICYQIEIPVGTAYKEIESIMEANEMEPNGYDWEDMIREYIHRQDPIFENKIESESEDTTCVLWLPEESNFRKLLSQVLELTSSLQNVRLLFA
jgi:hypothetical protein